MVVTFRPEYRPPWAGRIHYGQLPLHPLGPTACAELLADLLGPDPSLDGLAARIVDRTGGNPFFLEEVVHTLVEEGSLRGQRGAYVLEGNVGQLSLPATVQAVLASRIDRLAPQDKATLQTAAVIGRQFSGRLLAAVAGEADVRPLVDAELIYLASGYPDEEYTFKHALVEEVAYGSQLAKRRSRTHAAVGRALTELEPLDEQASLIAHHHELGGEPLEAARWHARAAIWAGFSNPSVAASHWRRVRMLTGQPEQQPEAVALGVNARLQLLSLYWRLGAAIEEAQGPFEDEAATLFREAEIMAEETGEAAVKAFVLMAYSAVQLTTDAVEEGYDLSTRAVSLADETQDPAARVVGRMGAWGLFLLGRVREAGERVGEMLDIIGDDRSIGRAMVVTSPYAWCRYQQAHFNTYVGRLHDGLAAIEEAIRIAGEEDDLETQAWAHRQWAVFADLAGADPEAAAAHAQAGLHWAEEAGGAWSRIFIREGVATSHAQRGQWRQAIEVVDEALAIARARRLSLADIPLLLSIRARAQIGHGDVARARQSAEEAVAVACRCGARFYEAQARHQLARTLDGPAATAELDRALATIDALGITAYRPRLLLDRGRISQR